MKKIITSIMVALFVAISSVSVNAQTAIESSKFFDNWSVGLDGGVVTPLKNISFFKGMRGVVGLELRKNITPVIGLGVEGQWSVNTSQWPKSIKSFTAFDDQLVGAFITGNLTNLFAGYRGTPRVFEVETQASIGWLHGYESDKNVKPYNSWYTKYGLNFNFNLGKTKAWTISLKPAVVYDMTNNGRTQYNVNYGGFELLAGITYHFKNSNGTHSFKLCDKQYSQSEWDALNAELLALQNRPMEVSERIIEVEKVIVNEVVVDNTSLNNVIGFTLNNANVAQTEYASLENVANWLKANANVKVNVIGYASAAEGSVDYNKELSLKRAQSVADILVNTFNVPSTQLNILGEGVTSQPFKENAWNRAVIFQKVEE